MNEYTAADARSLRIRELDGWRGISILCVIIGHAYNIRLGNQPPNVAYFLAYWGVDIFFIISGFIITRLALEEKARKGRYSVKAFYIRRVFRIVPPFYVYLAAIGCLGSFGVINHAWLASARAATFTCNIHVGPGCGWFAGHSWTLAFEEQFYLTFPIIFLFGERRINKILLGIFLALLGFPFIRAGLQMPEPWALISRLAPPFSFIATGAVAAAYEVRIRALIARRYRLLTGLACISLLLLVVVNGFFSFPLGSPKAYVQAATYNLFLPLSTGWLVISSAFKENYFAHVLKNRVLQFIGMISYSLYLWQELFIGGAADYLTNMWFFWPPLMFVMATLSYFLVEKPSLRAGRWLAASIAAHQTELARGVPEQTAS